MLVILIVHYDAYITKIFSTYLLFNVSYCVCFSMCLWGEQDSNARAFTGNVQLPLGHSCPSP
jgi:hypothetical protein